MEPSPYELIPIVGMILSFATAIAIIVIVSRSRMRRAEIQAELQSKLIEKFGSTPELIAFLQSPAGREFVSGVQSGPIRRVRDRAAGGIRIGIFFTAIGIAFLALWPVTDTPGLAWPGILLLVMGLAYFASAYSLMRFNAPQTDQLQPPSQPPAIS